MRILVTGGCGFIGTHLCRALAAQGHETYVLDDLSSGKRENLPDGAMLTVGDIRDSDLVGRMMADMDFCFHLAAIPSVQKSADYWRDTHSANLSGTICVFEALVKAGRLINRGPAPIIYASSAAVYGNGGPNPLAEDMRALPLTPYGADKLACELHAAAGYHLFGMPSIGFRFFNVYGPGQDPVSPYSGVISLFMKRFQEKEPIIIFGDGCQVRDFVYVGDVVNIMLAGMHDLLSRRDHRILNICTGNAVAIGDLADTIEVITGYKAVRIYKEERRGDIRTSIGNPAMLKQSLNILPCVSLQQGLSQL